jgi:hypothetical protein
MQPRRLATASQAACCGAYLSRAGPAPCWPQVRLWVQLPLSLLDLGTTYLTCADWFKSPAKGLAASAAAMAFGLVLCYTLDLRTRAAFARAERLRLRCGCVAA